MLVFHLLKLIPRNTTLQGKQVLVRNPVGLVKHLAPAVFASGLGSEHRQLVRGEHKIMITLTIGENEIGLLHRQLSFYADKSLAIAS